MCLLSTSLLYLFYMILLNLFLSNSYRGLILSEPIQKRAIYMYV